MGCMAEPGETLIQRTEEELTLSGDLKSSDLKPEIRVRGESIGAEVWGDMQKRTRQNGKEYGLTVWKGERLKNSDIIEGDEEMVDPVTGEVISPSVKPNSMLDYFKSFRKKITAFVHTHPDKSRFSRKDIESFVFGNYPAYVMLDSEGVHLLVRSREKDNLDAKEVAKAAYANVAEETQTSVQVRKSIADSVARFGIRYYLAEDTKPSLDGIVNFKDVRSN